MVARLTFAIATFILLTVSIFTVSRYFSDPMTEAKWYAFLLFLALEGFTVSIFSLRGKTSISHHILFTLEISAFIVCTLEAIYMLLCEWGYLQGWGRFSMGTFSNVAGFSSCISFSIPLGWKWMKKQALIMKILFFSAKFICIESLFLSGSRTGILCCIIFFFLYFPKNKKWLLATLPLVLALIFCFKTQSSMGRWFIFQQTIRMICQHPLCGWGINGFKAHYMDIQADFFKQHPQSEYALLADNIGHPLNEPLLITVNMGIIGLACTFMIIFFILRYAFKYKSTYSSLGLQILLCIGLFSLFSYPFLYPFTWIMAAFAIICIFHPIISRYRRQVCLASICILPAFGIWITQQALLSNKLRQAQEKAELGLSQKALTQLEELHPYLQGNYHFLYSYATVLYDCGQFNSSQKIAKECQKYIADYNLSLLLADIYREQGNKDSTLLYYNQAHYMCPSRLIPLYEMYHVYLSSGDSAQCTQLKNEILNKHVKVKSKEAEDIKRSIMDW